MSKIGIGLDPRAGAAQGLATVGADFAATGVYDLLAATALIPTSGVSPKFVYRTSGGIFYLMMKKPGGGGVLVQVERNVVTTTDSIGGAAEIYRPTIIRDLYDAAVFRDYSAQSGTWTTTTLNGASFGFSGATVGWNGTGSVNTPTTTENGAYIDYIVTPDRNGVVPLMFRSGNNACENVEISLVETSTVLVTGLSLARIGASSYHILLPVQTGRVEQVTIRVKHNGTAGRALYVIGAQWYWLGDPNTNMTTAKYNRYMSIRSDNHYSTSSGASDYAIREASAKSNKWAGSYHGGQTASVQSAKMDGRTVDADNPIQAGLTFSIYQESAISWASGGGDGALTVKETLTYHQDGVEDRQVAMTGSVLAKRFYTLMSTTAEGFTEVLSPKIATVASGQDVELGSAGSIVQRNPTTGQFVATLSTSFTGAFVRSSVGNYVKAYGGPRTDYSNDNTAPLAITDIAWLQRRIFWAA